MPSAMDESWEQATMAAQRPSKKTRWTIGLGGRAAVAELGRCELGWYGSMG